MDQKTISVKLMKLYHFHTLLASISGQLRQCQFKKLSVIAELNEQEKKEKKKTKHKKAQMRL